MRRALFALVAALLVAGCDRDPTSKEIARAATAGRLHISYPLEGTLFPPESVAPTFVWADETGSVDRWYVTVLDDGGAEVARATVDAPSWRPSEESWAEIKQRSAERDAEVVVAGVERTKRARILSSARVHLRTSKDEVGDALFYREVPLPFLTPSRTPPHPLALRDDRLAVRPADRAAEPARLRELPLVRGQRQRLGLDVDYGNDKGAYAIIRCRSTW
jgi:hypothetical protein